MVLPVWHLLVLREVGDEQDLVLVVEPALLLRLHPALHALLAGRRVGAQHGSRRGVFPVHTDLYVDVKHLLDDPPLLLPHHHHVGVGLVLPVDLRDVEQAAVGAEQRRVVHVRDRLPDVGLAGAEAADEPAPGEDEVGGQKVDPLGAGFGPLWPVDVVKEVGDPALLAGRLLPPLLPLDVGEALLLPALGAGFDSLTRIK